MIRAAVGTVKKSIVAGTSPWLRLRGRPDRNRETVRADASEPSMRSSLGMRGAPQRILRRHTPDQATDLDCRGGLSDGLATRLPGPMHDGVELDDDKDLPRPQPEAA